MKNPSINSNRLSYSKRIAALVFSAAVILAVVGWLAPLASTFSTAMRLALKFPPVAPAVPVQSQASTLYLHGTGPVNNPPTLFLNTTAPTATNEKFKDSAAISRNNGNPWKEVGTWPAASAVTTGTLTSLSDLHVWLGLKNSDDQGTFFDLRVEAYKNSTLITSGQSLCITGITRNANNAKEVVVNFDPFSAADFNGTSDVLSLKVLTRVGTSANGSSCGGHSNAVGLRLYFDAVSRASRFSATQGGADTTPPVLVVDQPSEDSLVTASAQINVAGTFSDQSPTTITVNGVSANINGQSFSATVSLNDGPNPLLVVATDTAGNRTEFSAIVTRDNTPPVIDLVQPQDGFVTDSTSIAIGGTITDLTTVTVTLNDQPVLVSDDGFAGQVTVPEGVNQVRVVAVDAAGNQTEVTRTVIADDTEPVISDLSPVAGTLIDGTSVSVQGRVTDATPVSVTIGTTTANAGAGGFFTANVPIVEGENEFVITATDVAGNKSETELLLEGKDMTAPAATVVFPVKSPTKLHFQTIEGRAEPGTKVRITGGVAPAETMAAGGTGLFAVNVELAFGTNALQITSTDATNNVSPSVSVSISSDPNLELAPNGQPSRIAVATGDTQRGLVGVELPRPLIVILRDKSGNPVSGTTVRFTVTHGGGVFSNSNAFFDAQTDGDGYASARYVSGATPGIQLIRADFASNLLTSTTFMAEALTGAPGGVTSVSGTVCDVNLRALPNVLVRISGQQTRTGADGRFRIENVPAGPHQVLELIGRDQITLPGRWPNISYDIDVLSGIDNNLGRQLFLPKVNDGIPLPLDANNVVTQNTSAQLPVVGGEPPIVITARAGTQVIFPPDVTDKRLSVTRIPVSRVPMPLEDGLATNLFISVQPSGAIFDQPLEVSFPNLDQLSPNTEVLLMSFDHDAGRYVQVGTGRVSADGRTVNSDPGSGIRVGAWHAFPPSPPSPNGGAPPTEEITVLGQIRIAGNPDLEGKHIDEVLAQLNGNRAMVLTERAEWHNVEEITLRGRETRRRGGGGAPAPVAIDAQVQTTIPEVTLEDVSFKDNYALRPDDGGEEYDGPHWQKPANPNPNHKGEPVAYRNEGQKKIKLAAKFSLAQEITEPPKPKVMVKADGNEAFDLDAVVAKYDKRTKTVKLDGSAVATAFPTDTIDYIEAMNFKWEVSLDGGGKWLPAGTSSNQMYVTLGKPGKAYHTTVHLATKNLRGLTKTARDAIITAIWRPFNDRAVFRATDTGGSQRLGYWLDHCKAQTLRIPPNKMECFEPKSIVQFGDGRCEAWQEFFMDVLKTQDVGSSKFNLVAKRLGDRFRDSAIIVNPGNPGQGNPSPHFQFNGHAIVKVGNKLYDPSYGTGPFDDLAAWEDVSLHSVLYFTNVDDTQPAFTQPNRPAPSQETEELRPPVTPPGPPPGPEALFAASVPAKPPRWKTNNRIRNQR